MDSFFDQKVGFEDDQYVEFSKQTQDRIIGTYDSKARVSYGQAHLQLTLFLPAVFMLLL